MLDVLVDVSQMPEPSSLALWHADVVDLDRYARNAWRIHERWIGDVEIGSVDDSCDEALFVWSDRPELSMIANKLKGIGYPR
jgi:hypothetical protein